MAKRAFDDRKDAYTTWDVAFGDKPENASYRVKMTLRADGSLVLTPPDSEVPHRFDEIVVQWRDEGVRIIVPKGGPAALTQVMLGGAGQDVLVEVQPQPKPQTGRWTGDPEYGPGTPKRMAAGRKAADTKRARKGEERDQSSQPDLFTTHRTQQ